MGANLYIRRQIHFAVHVFVPHLELVKLRIARISFFQDVPRQYRQETVRPVRMDGYVKHMLPGGTYANLEIMTKIVGKEAI